MSSEIKSFIYFSLLAALLTIFAQVNFLFFHTLVEGWAIIVAVSIFIIALNTRKVNNNNYITLLGFGYLCIAILTFFHTFTYEGITFIIDAGPDPGIQFWMAARFLETLVLFPLPFLIKSELKQRQVNLIIGGYFFLTVLAILTILVYSIFPTCFEEGVGLTSFKIYSEYVIIALLGITIYNLYQRRDNYERDLFEMLVYSLLATIIAELFFTFYKDVYGVINILGHIFYLLSFYILYRIIVKKSLQEPQRFLYNDLKMANSNVKKINQCFLSFTSDNDYNIEQIVETTGKLLKADSTFYNQVTGDKFKAISSWNGPENIKQEYEMEDHPANYVINKDSREPVLITNIDQNEQFLAYPGIKEYGLKTYIGCVAYVNNQKHGVLAALFKRDIKPTQQSLDMLSTLTRAVGIEIQRKETQKELFKAKQEAEAANKAKSQFLANMSHEIRTPLNAITSLINLCLNTDLDDKQRDYLTKANVSSKSLLRIINDILDLSKVEADELDIESVPFELDNVLYNLWTLIANKAQKKGLELLFSRSLDIPDNLIGDPLRLEQVLTNLVSNAVKFTEFGEVVLYIEVKERSEESIILKFTVVDTGIGISKEDQHYLFEPFFQADSSATREFGGTGLGLTIAKRLVEMMNGEIWVESEVGKGTTFFFTAEFTLVDNEVQQLLVPPELCGLRVLVVDDNATAREIFKNYLESFSFQVTVVESGEAAISKLETAEKLFGLLLVDWNMPGLNGLEVARRVVNNSKIIVPPKIILVSAFAREDVLAEAGVEYLDTFLTKPTSPSQLFDSIMNIFGYSFAVSAAYREQELDLEDLRPIQGARILLVEDNLINQEVCCELLEQHRFRVDVANNGQEALEMLEPGRYDCVLMDVQMPIMDGYEATRKIRSDERFKQLPILALTANAMEEHKRQSREAGLNDHISKPIDFEELFGVLLKWIEPGERQLPQKLATEEETKEDFSKLAGLNTQAGLARMKGNTKAYRKLLVKFLVNQADTVERIRQAFNKGDYQTVERLAHGLKGVAANIGAVDLQEATADLEIAVQEETEEMEEKLAVLEEELQRVITAIESANLQVSKQKTKEKIDSKDLLDLLYELRSLIKEYDTQAIELLEDILTKRIEEAIEESLVELEENLSKYDFERALEQINELIKKMED
ncbi:MASE3 domain-containing protein [Fuchsiella alkaliacetigena]|uniref:MASE3 domain-containing protein n=1 Tax=Fuchsiella alkaliacetigena TaxID=957042 RepID=UPI00200B52D3|nr:MASE3 domain-containing protein [Fuchsiella alkaliacetigena]MCK8824054.1 response regulator [Fuchsiella alkaliacetigena]